jgi:hypothetical protein
MRPHSIIVKNNELRVAHLVRFLVVKLAHPDSSSQLDTNAHIFMDLF